MALLIYLCKIIAALVMGYRLYVMLKFKLDNKTASFSFELMSRIEVAAGYGVFLISVLSKVEPSSYLFSLLLNVINLVIVVTHSLRIVVASKDKIMIRLKIYEKKKIRGIRTSWFSLHVFPRNEEEFRVLVPLTYNTAFDGIKYLS